MCVADYSKHPAVMAEPPYAQIFEQLSNEKGTKLYTLQKRFQSAFGFTLRKLQSACQNIAPLTIVIQPFSTGEAY